MESGISVWLQAWWAPALAFAAGVVSFASPCVFPLVPGYVSFVTGGQDREEASPLVPLLLFVLGFAALFTSMGAFAGTVRTFVLSSAGQRIAGAVVLAFGLFMMMYALRLGGPWLYAERRPLLERVRPGRAAAFPLGVAFGAGWTPCVGPVLAGIFAIAAAQGGGAWGALLLFVYSLGLGLPFILLGVGMRRLMGALAFVKRNYHWFAGTGGIVMILVGTLLVLDLWQLFLARTGLLNLLSGFTPPI